MSGIFIHRSSYVEPGSSIGDGTKIWHFCHVMDGAVIGRNCVLGQNVYIAANVRIGDGCRIQNNVSLFDGVTLEDDVFVGPSVVFTNVKRPRAYKRGKYEKTYVKRGATIGANATIVCGVTIGENSFVGAGSVVTKDVPDHTIVWGVPAKVQSYAWIRRELTNKGGEHGKEEKMDSKSGY